MVKLLLKHGADPNRNGPYPGRDETDRYFSYSSYGKNGEIYDILQAAGWKGEIDGRTGEVTDDN